MDRISYTFRSASFDAEEFADGPVDPPDEGPQSTRIAYEAFDLVCRESSDDQTPQSIRAGMTTEYAKDLAAMNERLARLVAPLRPARMRELMGANSRALFSEQGRTL